MRWPSTIDARTPLSSHPSISICVAAKGECDAMPFLNALIAQGLQPDENTDIHLAHDAELSGDAELVRLGWHLHRCSPGTSILRLWGQAIAASAHSFVAVLDINCPPDTGWWNGVMREMRAGTRVFTGPVAPGWRPEQRMIAGYLVDYAQFHRPHHPSVHEVPGINFVCARELLDPPATLATRGFFKTFMLWRLAREQNLTAARCDDIQVVYRRPLAPRSFLRRRYRHGRCFAGRRFDNPNQPPRWACVAFAPFLPLLKCWRIARAARRHAELQRAYWRQIHWVMLAESAWSWGEFVGYVFGAGDACADLD